MNQKKIKNHNHKIILKIMEKEISREKPMAMMFDQGNVRKNFFGIGFEWNMLNERYHKKKQFWIE